MRVHKTVTFGGHKASTPDTVDSTITEALTAIARIWPEQVVLFHDFKVFSVETNYLPPRRETYLTVIADIEEQ